MGASTHRQAEPALRRSFAEFQGVRLVRPVLSAGVTFPAGTRGVVVDIHAADRYGVEVSAPLEDVLVVSGADLRPD